MAVLVLHWLLLKREEKNSKSCLMHANSEIIRLHELVKMLCQLEKICIGVYSYVFVCSYHYLNLNKSRFTSLVLPFLIVLFAKGSPYSHSNHSNKENNFFKVSK